MFGSIISTLCDSGCEGALIKTKNVTKLRRTVGMKKIIHGLLVAALTVSSTASAAITSNKTFMADRGSLSNNAAMGMTVGANGAKAHNGFGADVSVSAFYRQTHNHEDMAKYFGGGTTDTARTGKITLGNDDVIYEQTGTATYKPFRQEYGAHVAWTQCLGKLVQGLSLKVDLPILHVQTRMGATYSATNIKTYFEGGQAANANMGLLTNQKHSSTDNSETGIANIGAAVAYKLASDADYCVRGKVTVDIPTGNKPAGVWAFEPLYGSKHFALGAGLDAMFNLWRADDGKSSLDFNACVGYKYGFKAKEVRTLGIYGHTASADVDQAHYRIVVIDGTDTARAFANVGTKEVDVTPQSSINGLAGFSYHNGQFSVDAMYNLSWNQEEKVELLDNWSATDATYGIVEADDTDGDGSIHGDHSAIAKVATATADGLSVTPAKTPSKVTHKVAGGVGYSFNTKTPIRVGLGAEGEFNSNNNSANYWGIWAKFGVCF